MSSPGAAWFGVAFSIAAPTTALYRLYLDRLYPVGAPARGRVVPRPLAIVLIGLVSCAAIYWALPDAFLPVAANYNLEVHFLRLEPAEQPFNLADFDGNNMLGSALRAETTKLGLKATTRGDGGSLGFGSEFAGASKVKVLLLASEPVLHNAELPIPSGSSDMLYLLRNGQWEPHPEPVTHKAKETIQLTVSPNRRGAFLMQIKGYYGPFNSFFFTPRRYEE